MHDIVYLRVVHEITFRDDVTPGIGCSFHDCTANVVPTVATLRVNHETQKPSVLWLFYAMVVLHFHKNILDGVVYSFINLYPEPFNFVVLTMVRV